MVRPTVYVHRLGKTYSLYMNRRNEAALQSFANVVSDGTRDEPLLPEELIERMHGASAILSLSGRGAKEITADVLKSVGTIEVICIAHWMGQLVDPAKEAGVRVTEGSNANTVAVAEWTVASALMGVRRLREFDSKLKSGSPWAEPRRDVGLLCESTVGLVGLGRIGWYACHYFKALGANIIAYDKDKEKAAALGVRLVGLDELLTTADVVSLHLPVTAETSGMLGAREFSLIRDGAAFINSARAALYDEPALVAELQKERFSAYLDVFSTEPLPLDHPFRSLDNVFITPHVAGDNAVMFLRCGLEAIQTLQQYFEGKGLRNLQYSFP